MEQLELFPNFANIKISSKGVDISKIKMRYKGGNINSGEGNRLIKRLNGLPRGVYYAYAKGHPKLPIMPFVRNEKTKNVVKVNPNRNQYPAVNVGGVTIAIHKLMCLCFHKNSSPDSKIIVDHINKDNEDITCQIYKALSWDPIDVSAGWQYVDWRTENLRWASESENKKNPQRKKGRPKRLEWINWEDK